MYFGMFKYSVSLVQWNTWHVFHYRVIFAEIHPPKDTAGHMLRSHDPSTWTQFQACQKMGHYPINTS